MNKVINISSNGIKQAIDDLVNENELLQDKIYKQNEEIERLNNIINELEKYIIDREERSWDDNGAYNDVLDKLQELKGSDEPSFEKMVGFVENVCKDIKSQSTLHEELEEERKTIAKIVGDLKEVNK